FSILSLCLTHCHLHPLPTRRSSDLALDHISGFGVNQPLVPGFVPEIAVNDRACEVLAGLAFGLKSGTDFTAGVSGVKSVPLFNRSEEHTSELQSRFDLVCRLLLEKK